MSTDFKMVQGVGTRQDAIAYAKDVLSHECRKLGFNPEKIDWLDVIINNTLYLIANPTVDASGRRNVEYGFGPDGYLISMDDIDRARIPSLVARIRFEKPPQSMEAKFKGLDNRLYPDPALRRELDRFERVYQKSYSPRAYWHYQANYHDSIPTRHGARGEMEPLYTEWIDPSDKRGER